MTTILKCTKCGEDKPASEFHKDSSKARGFVWHCKLCSRERFRRISESKKVPCLDCGKPCKKERCITCHNKSRTGTGKGHRNKGNGYVQMWVDGKSVQQHRHVMSESLGRGLLKGENVHHKNGVRHDNRIENLELWVSHQPSGQRPDDLLEWADEIIRRYRHAEQDGTALP